MAGESTGNTRDSSLITIIPGTGFYLDKQALIVLAGIELTDHNRDPLEIDKPSDNMVRLVNGKGKIILTNKSRKRTFGISWKSLPGNSINTIDARGGRNTIYDLANITEPMELVIHDVNRSVTYTVRVASYSDSLNKRYLGDFYWDVNLSLEEV